MQGILLVLANSKRLSLCPAYVLINSKQTSNLIVRTRAVIRW